MKKPVQLIVSDKFKATTEEDKLIAVKQAVVALVVREWQKKTL